MNVLNLRWLLNRAWTGPTALACFAHTGWDTFPAWLALLPSLALKVLLNTTWKIKCLNEVGHFTNLVGHLTRYPGRPRKKDIQSIPAIECESRLFYDCIDSGDSKQAHRPEMEPICNCRRRWLRPKALTGWFRNSQDRGVTSEHWIVDSCNWL